MTYPAGSNETGLLSRDGRARNRRGLTNVLVVTTTVRVIDGVHSNTTCTRPAKGGISITVLQANDRSLPVTLGLVFVVRATSLEQRFVDTSATSDNPDRRTRA